MSERQNGAMGCTADSQTSGLWVRCSNQCGINSGVSYLTLDSSTLTAVRNEVKAVIMNLNVLIDVWIWVINYHDIHHLAFIIRQSSFGIHHSAFIIWHSSFGIHHSAFIIWHSSFGIHHSAFIIRYSSFGIRHSAFISWHSSFGIHHSAFIIRHSSFGIHHSSLPRLDLRQNTYC